MVGRYRVDFDLVRCVALAAAITAPCISRYACASSHSTRRTLCQGGRPHPSPPSRTTPITTRYASRASVGCTGQARLPTSQARMSAWLGWAAWDRGPWRRSHARAWARSRSWTPMRSASPTPTGRRTLCAARSVAPRPKCWQSARSETRPTKIRPEQRRADCTSAGEGARGGTEGRPAWANQPLGPY